MLTDYVTPALAELRQHAESRMTSRCMVELVDVTADPLTGQDIETATVVLPELRCRVRLSTATGRNQTAPGRGTTAGLTSPMLHVPWDTTGLAVGMRITITAAESPLLTERKFRIVQPPDGDQLTAQRWEMEGWTT